MSRGPVTGRATTSLDDNQKLNQIESKKNTNELRQVEQLKCPDPLMSHVGPES